MTACPLRAAALVAGALAVLALVGCTDPDAAPSSVEESDAPGHGFVAGASENPEPQLQLAVIDGDGAVHVDDLLTGESIELGRVGDGPIDAVASDGRLLAVTSGSTTTLVDSGTWTVDHGDHAHYYRADARILESLETGGPTRIKSSEKLTVLFTPATGATVILDRDGLAAGDVEEVGALDGVAHDGAALPLGRNIVATVAETTGRADEIGVFSPEGTPQEESVVCEDARGGAVTRVGAVIGCADGAVLAVEDDDGTVSFERIPYPAGTDPAIRALVFHQRPGRPSVAAVAGGTGAWVLDTRARTWQLLPSERPLTAAVAADDERDLVVALDVEGRVIVIEPESGKVNATDPLTADPSGATLEVDADRAYVNDPGSRLVHEIDYADSARLARSLEMPVTARFFAETGR